VSDHRDTSTTRFKWLVIASLVALVLILGTIQNLAK
jgi:hypothetical protein